MSVRVRQATVALLLAALCSPAIAGRFEGPGHILTEVEAYSTDHYTIFFRGGEKAKIIVDGDGDTDLDLYVYDEYGNLVDSDTDYTDYCIAQWYPAKTGVYYVEVRNLGSVYNRYTMNTN